MAGYILKRVGVLFLIVSLCISSTGFMSLATYSNNDMLVNERSEIDFLANSDSKINEMVESVDEDISIPKIASASNIVRINSVVTTAAELEAAIEIAVDGDVIEIANDIYLSQPIIINKSITFKAINDGIIMSIYASDRSRHFIIDGDEIYITFDDIILDGGDLGGGIESHAKHLVLSGAIIKKCAAQKINIYLKGGAIEASGELTLIDSEISKNSANRGGGIFGQDNLNIVNSIICENEALEGGGGFFASTKSITIIDSTISDNHATSYGGGGLKISNCSHLIITNSELLGNYAESVGGAMLISSVGTLNISHCIFADNQAKGSGGGAYVQRDILYDNEFFISDCKFVRNSAELSSGALHLNGDIVSISNSEFIDNEADSYGGALTLSSLEFNILNCNFTRNNATFGGGISLNLVDDAVGQMKNSKLRGNNAVRNGGAIYIDNKMSEMEHVFTISNCEIVNNSAASGGGIGYGYYSKYLESIKIKDYSIVKNNFAERATRLIADSDLPIHSQLVDSTVIWTEGFNYLFNNLDIQYEKNTDLTIYKINIIESFEDSSEVTFYPGIKNEKFQYYFTAPQGYEATIESSIDVTINMTTGLIEVESIISDVDITITYKPKKTETIHIVTLITHYLDGIMEDTNISYQVESGNSFEQVYKALEGYEFAGMSIRSSYPIVDGDTRMVYIDSVTEDYTITIKLARKVLNVKITTQYMDGNLPDTTTSYSVFYGDDFAESYEALNGYTFVGMSVRSFPYVDGDLQIVYIDEVKEDYHIIIKLDRAEYNVIITVQYPEGTIDSQVYTYSVLSGESFLESFEVESGYRIAGVQAEKGVDVDSQNRVIEIERVLKDMSITIICR